MYDTSYSLAATARDADIPQERMDEVAELPDIKTYFKERYGGVPDYTSNDTVSLNGTDTAKKDLF